MKRLITTGSFLGVSSGVRLTRTDLTTVSVHEYAINCSDAADRRWTLLTCSEDFLPRSILFEALPPVNRGDSFMINLDNSPVLFQAHFQPEPISQRWTGLVSEWISLLDAYELSDLYLALERGDPLHSLSGLGPGFTPAGDDFITGWITSKLNQGAGALPEIYAFNERWNPENTTWFSAWMIKDALHGRIWRRGAVLSRALARGIGVPGAVADILNWGHTSGRAWLAGFACGFISREKSKEMVLCRS